MSHQLSAEDKQSVKKAKVKDKQQSKDRPTGPGGDSSQILRLQQTIGNQAVQRLIAQRSDEGAFELEDDLANRINTERGQGQSLDEDVQQTMSKQMGYDFSDVRVHTSSEANDLNESLNAKAFTTGQDVFFKDGSYDPGSSGGQELIAHELTHVVQQSSGQVDSTGSGMVVNPPGDTFEQEADAVAQSVGKSEVEAQTENSALQMQVEDDADIQRQVEGEELEEEEVLEMETPDTADLEEEMEPE